MVALLPVGILDHVKFPLNLFISICFINPEKPDMGRGLLSIILFLKLFNCQREWWSFVTCGQNSVKLPFKWNLPARTFTWCYSFFQHFKKRNFEILVAFCHIWQRKGKRTKHVWSFRRLTHRNKEVMKLFAGVELVWVVKLVRWQEFAETFVVDIREGSHVVRKTRSSF